MARSTTTASVDDDGVRDDERHRAFARLFPKARVQRPLTTSPHPVGVVAARSWHRISLALLAAGIAVLVEILLLSGPTSLVGFGWTPLVIGVAATLAGMFGFAWSHRELRPRTHAERTAWDAWARDRGLVSVTPGEFTPAKTRSSRRAIGSARLHLEPSRSFTPMYQAMLGGGSQHGVKVHLGTAFIHGPWGAIRNMRMGCIAAIIDLPSQTGQRLPASTLDRFVRGERPLRGRAGTKLRQLRLESQDFDDACDLRVDAGSDDLEWYRLLDPTMLDGLARDWPVSWQQDGSTLVVYIPAPVMTLDAVQLDTLCLAAEAIGNRFQGAATTTEAITEEVRERRALRGATHRRRRILHNVVSWAVVLAVLAVPIYLVTTLDARETEARVAKIREREAEFQRTYVLETDSAESIYAVRQASELVARCPDRCTGLSPQQRSQLIANGAISEERADGLRIERDGPRTRVSSTSEAGVTFTLAWRGDIPETGERTCAPKGESCPDGTWGGPDG